MKPEIHERLKSQHDSTYWEVIHTNQYQIERKDLDGMNVIDIGANNGTFTVLANDYGAKKIVAAEPNIGAFKLLAGNIEGTSAVIMNCAVLSDFGKVSVDDTQGYCQHDGRHYVVNDPEGNVDCIPFKELLKHFDDKPIVLKIDCEGSEYDIIYGASIEDIKRCKTILIEMHENFGHVKGEFGLMSKLAKYLEDLGYECAWATVVVPNIASLFRFNLKEEPVTITTERLFHNQEFRSSESALNIVDSVNEITVVISEFIRPELLEAQIEAFQNQTKKPKEIIVWQTQLDGKSEAYDFVNKYDNVHIIKTTHDFGLNSRFAIPLIAKTAWVCLVDDDVFPAPGWIEECYKISREFDVVVCPYGWNYTSDYSDMTSKRYGDHGEHSNDAEDVQIGGHGWFGRKEWFSLFWKENPVSLTHADDIHFAYSLKKFENIGIMVSAYPEDNKLIWGNTRPEAGLGFKALHARKFEDVHVWGDLKNVATTDGTGYLADNLTNFCKQRDKIVRMYLEAYPKLFV